MEIKKNNKPFTIFILMEISFSKCFRYNYTVNLPSLLGVQMASGHTTGLF
jgi:hypothetical protein